MDFKLFAECFDSYILRDGLLIDRPHFGRKGTPCRQRHRIDDPSEAFHYSYKYTDANGWVENEAEITPQAMDITIKDKSGSHTFHGVRSDEASWNSAVIDLSHLNITAMSSRLNALNDSSAIVQQGRESVNGYDTTKYSIDTGSANSSDRQKFETLFGKGASEKGTAWMAPDSCVAKFTLDETIMKD